MDNASLRDSCLCELDSLSTLLDIFISNNIEDVGVDVYALISRDIMRVREKLEKMKL